MVFLIFVNKCLWVCVWGREGSIHLQKNYGGFCIILLMPNALIIQNNMADSDIILYLGFLVGPISQIEKSRST